MEESLKAIEARQFGNRWLFRRVTHPGPALWFLRLAVKLGDTEALFIIVRYMISMGHRGSKRMRDTILEWARLAAKTGKPRFVLFYAFLRDQAGDVRGFWDGIGDASDRGDRAGQLLHAYSKRVQFKESGDLEAFGLCYRLLCKSASSGCVEALAALGSFLVEDGCSDVGRKLLLQAANCGSAFAYVQLNWGGSGLGTWSPNPFDFENLVADVHGRVLRTWDEDSALNLAFILTFEIQDTVLLIRLLRRCVSTDARKAARCVLFGERLWDFQGRTFSPWQMFLMDRGIPNQKRFDFQLR